MPFSGSIKKTNLTAEVVEVIQIQGGERCAGQPLGLHVFRLAPDRLHVVEADQLLALQAEGEGTAAVERSAALCARTEPLSHTLLILDCVSYIGILGIKFDQPL